MTSTDILIVGAGIAGAGLAAALGGRRDTILIEPLPAYQAQAKFLQRFEEIEADRQSSTWARA